MAFPFRGNTTNTATSPVQSLPNMIDSFRIVNKTGATIGVNVYLFDTATPANQFCIAPNSAQINANSIYEQYHPIVLLPTQQIKIQTSGNIDYDFTIKNLNVDEE